MRRASPSPEPVLGPRARTAAKLPLALGPKQHKLLLLLAAYADAGEPSPPVRELARGLGLDGGPRHVRAAKVDKRLRELERAGLLTVRWRASAHEQPRNVYELRLQASASRSRTTGRGAR